MPKKTGVNKNIIFRLSLLSLFVIFLIIVFIPKKSSTDQGTINYTSAAGKFRKAEDLASPDATEKMLYLNKSQSIDDTLLVDSVLFFKPGFIVIMLKDGNDVVGTSDILNGQNNNVSIKLNQKVTDDTTLIVKLYTDNGNGKFSLKDPDEIVVDEYFEPVSEEITIEPQRLPEGIILPKDLQ